LNKRQAKKQFKKKYGITPKEAEKLLQVDLYEKLKDITPRVTEAICTFAKQMAEMCAAAVQTINEGIPMWTEAIKRFADTQRTEEMLRKSIPIHPDLDDDLLDRLEIREISKDSLGMMWKFYWDPANEVMYAKEMEENDDK